MSTPENRTSSRTFSYEAVAADGRRTKSTMVGPSHEAVKAALVREGWIPLRVDEISNKAMNRDIFAFITGGGVKFKWAARAEFARRMHQMLRAGISVPRTLVSMSEDAPKDVAAMCLDMADKVMSGQTLSSTMGGHPRAFDETTIAYIQAGEEAGTLVQTTDRLAVMLAKRAELGAKIKAVSAYPKMVGGAILVITVGIILFMVPMFAKIYAGFGAKLPAPTMALIWVSEHFLPVSFSSANLGSMTVFLPIPHPFNIGSIVAAIVVSILVFKRKTRNNIEIGTKLDRILFRLPLAGALMHKQSLQRWATTLSGALSSGVNMTKALDLAARASGSRWHQSVAPDLAEAIATGRTISSEISKHPRLYPPNVRTMMSTGEETGELDTMLSSVADALDSDIDSIVAGLSAQVEVALLLVLGGVVGGLIVVLYAPILNLAATANKGLGG